MLTDAQSRLLDVIEEALVSEADPDKAAGMKAYMKNRFDFMGVQKPARTAIQKTYFPQLRKLGLLGEDLLHHCWQKNEREWQYLGMDYALSQPKNLPQKLADWAYWITEKSWWDTVDLLATRGVGFRLQNDPEMRSEVIGQWRHAPNMWLNRSCILFQLHYKKQTDVQLLADLCVQYAGSKEFFIQKAMGWALRHYSRTDAQWVMHFVEQQPLPALSKREALRLL
jgi:3-methyladenine DNA glycosylase AlkD